LATPPYQPGECLRIRDERWRLVCTDGAGDTATLDVVGCDTRNGGVRAVFLTGAEHVARLPSNDRPRLVRPARWRRIARQRLAAASPRFDSLRAAATADITLLPFQLEPALSITHGLGCRLLIADEVGLGKTIQAGLIIAETLARVPNGHALVVAPAALRSQWVEELQRRFQLSAATIDAPAIARMVGILGSGTNPWAGCRVVIVSIDYIKRAEVMRALEALVWDVVVFDEAHVLAGVSDRAAAAQQLSARAHTLVSLTATPHSGDIQAFARLTALGRLGPASPPLVMFRRTRRDVGLMSARRTRWFSVRATAAEAEMHRALLQYARAVCRQRHASANPVRLAMSILLKRGCSSATSLARSLERRLALLSSGPLGVAQMPLPFETTDDEEPSGALAVPGLSDRGAEQAMLAALLDKARTAAQGESKTRALRRLLRRRLEPAIVFTEYRDTLEQLAQSLDRHHITVVHGGLTLSERRAALKQFTHGTADILLATDAASEGLNLHHRCRRVVNMELPWSPLRLEQRIGRVDRIGQRQIVHATHLIAHNTIEEQIVARLLARISTADAVLSGMSARDEDDVVSAVTAAPGDASAPALAETADEAERIVVPDLRELAERELGQLLLTSRLAAEGKDDLAGRPLIARIRYSGRRQRVWAMRLSFADAAGQIRWTTLLGVTANGAVESSAVRRALDTSLLRPHLNERLSSAAAHLAESATRFASAAIARDDEILLMLQSTRARLGPRAPGLFDRREEREAAAQLEVLAEAVHRCEQHRQHLRLLQDLTVSTPELVFAVVLE
jgi:superfamily II DNA or RNA helicase